MQEIRIVKRYGNRKLYDTELSSYVTLSELTSTVNDGVEIKVIDYKTNQDVTHRTLMSALLERETTRPSFSLSEIKELLK